MERFSQEWITVQADRLSRGDAANMDLVEQTWGQTALMDAASRMPGVLRKAFNGTAVADDKTATKRMVEAVIAQFKAGDLNQTQATEALRRLGLSKSEMNAAIERMVDLTGNSRQSVRDLLSRVGKR